MPHIIKVRDCEDCEYFGVFSCMGLLDVELPRQYKGLISPLTYETKCPDKKMR
jgi:hypothetical protein